MAFTTEDRNDVIALAVAVWDAAPGASNLSELAVQFNNGATMLEITEGLTQSEIFTNEYPAFLTNEEFAEEFVGSVLNGTVSEDDQQWAVDQLTSQLNGGASQAEVILGAIEALQAVPEDDANWGDAAATFNNKVDVATYYSVELEKSGSSLADLKAVIADVDETESSVEDAKEAAESGPDESNPGETFSLTTGTDVIDGTADDDTVVGVIDTDTAADSTLNVSDVITGGDGTDKMNLTVTGIADGSLPAAYINGVENFFIRDVADTASAYDFSTVTGEEQVWVDRATNDVDMQNLGSGAALGIQGNGSTNLGDVSFNMASATGAVNIVLAGGVTNSNAAPTITNTNAGAATSASITSTGGSNTVGLVTLAADASNSVESLTITAASNLTAELEGDDFDGEAELTISGEGDVDLSTDDGATFETISAGDLSGDLTANINVASADVTTGEGSDTLTLTAGLTSGASVVLGAGDDTLLNNGGSVASGVTVDGGAGFDSIAASLINAANAENIENFEALDLSSATASALDADLLTGSSINELTLNGGTGGATVNNVDEGVGLTVKGENTGTTTIGTEGDEFAVAFDGSAASTASATNLTKIDAGTLVVDDVANLSIDSSGDGIFMYNDIDVDSDDLETIEITGDTSASVTFTKGGTAPVDASDPAGMTEIDGSDANGRLTINTTNANAANAGLTVTGGSNDDTITLAQEATVVGGAGDDSITVSADGGELTGGAGEDTFDVSAAVAPATPDADNAVLTTITDLEADDIIDFGIGSAFASDKVELGTSVTNLTEALEDSVTTANDVSWFQYAGNTYLVADEGDAAFGADDVVVKLSGTVDLSDATLDGTELTMA